MKSMTEVEGMTPMELDERVQSLAREGKFYDAADMIESWVHWDWYGRWDDSPMPDPVEVSHAEVIARVTGSRSATVKHTHRDPETGEIVVDRVERATRKSSIADRMNAEFDLKIGDDK